MSTQLINGLSSLPGVTTAAQAEAADAAPSSLSDTSSSICSLDREPRSCLDCFTSFFSSCWDVISYIFASIFCCRKSIDVERVEAFIKKWTGVTTSSDAHGVSTFAGLDKDALSWIAAMDLWKADISNLPERALIRVKMELYSASVDTGSYKSSNERAYDEGDEFGGNVLSNQHCELIVDTLLSDPLKKQLVLEALQEWIAARIT